MRRLRSPSVMTLIKPSKNIRTRDPARAMYSRLYGLVSGQLGEETVMCDVPEEPPEDRNSNHDCCRLLQSLRPPSIQILSFLMSRCCILLKILTTASAEHAVHT